jgi:hypothetical protein
MGPFFGPTSYPMDILPPDEGKEIFKPVQAELRDGDIAFGNLEGSLCDEGKPIKCRVPLSGNCFELANSLQLAEGKAKRFFVTEVHCSNPPTIRKEINSTGEDNRYTALLCFATCKST